MKLDRYTKFLLSLNAKQQLLSNKLQKTWIINCFSCFGLQCIQQSVSKFEFIRACFSLSYILNIKIIINVINALIYFIIFYKKKKRLDIFSYIKNTNL